MTLARRLLLGALVVITLLVVAIVSIAGGRLRSRLVQEKVAELTRDARVVGLQWTTGTDADRLAHRTGAALGYRVTLIDTSGAVVGDSDFEPEARRRLENHATRPEIVAARGGGAGTATRRSASAGDDELYLAISHPLGFVRVALSTQSLDAIVGGAQSDVLTGGLLALAGAFVLAVLYARSISRPVVELRDVARDIAAGDLTRRPALAAPGEIGDLATALHRMADQLEMRLDDLGANDALMIAVLESLEEGILAFDAQGMVVRLNERARVLLDVAQPLPFSRDRLPRDPIFRVALDRALAGSSTAPSETALLDRTIAVAGRPLPGAGAVVTVLDLTMLRRLETVRQDFVANVSHELKTPLTAVRGFAETLLDDDIPAPQRRQFVETIRDNARRMQRIVDDLLDLSRIESGGWQPRMDVVDVAAVVREVFASVPAAASAALDLRAEMPASGAAIHADPTALAQIASNLVENAVRHTRQGSVTVTMRIADGGAWLDVRDTGSGIGAEHLPRIFERFYRVDAGRSREQGGTGLGLAIVRHLVDAHGGRVEAASVVGQGTTISIFFPQPPTSD